MSRSGITAAPEVRSLAASFVLRVAFADRDTKTRAFNKVLCWSPAALLINKIECGACPLLCVVTEVDFLWRERVCVLDVGSGRWGRVALFFCCRSRLLVTPFPKRIMFMASLKHHPTMPVWEELRLLRCHAGDMTMW
jgi:hypothetical protein